MRKHYIDNLRLICILLLFPYHTSMIFNDFGENFYIRGEIIFWFGSFIRLNAPYFMPLLFVIAGISTFYSLQKRSYNTYIKERFLKLFIPLVFGILLIIPVQTYYAEKFHNGYTGSYLNQLVMFFTKDTDLTGYTGGFTPAHLWFIFYLFLISLIALPLILSYKKLTIFNFKKYTVLKLLPLFIITSIFSLVLEIGGKSFGEFFILFIFGYYLFSNDDIMAKLDKSKLYLLLGFIILSIVNLYFQYQPHFYTGSPIYGIFYRLVGWVGILAFLGLGKHYLEKRNKVTDYLSKSSFPIYILHQSILVAVAYYVFRISVNSYYKALIILVGSVVMTFLVYELFRRTALTRFLFGIKK